jgi:radical SAM superfamily enzyme YgiQ (UPF0313 family)
MTMKAHFLLINPWVYDFSALNLWSRPLGLLKLAEYLSQYTCNISLIDCTGELKKMKRYATGKYLRTIIEKPELLKDIPRHYARYGIGINEFRSRLERALPADIVFVTSIMTYWYPGVNKAIEIVKEISPGTPVILGGIYATLFNKHALNHSGADHVYTGQINSPSSFSHRGGNDKPENAGIEEGIERYGIRLIKGHPQQPYYRLGLYDSYLFAPLLTSYGCPNNCSYCASSALSPGFQQKDPYDVVSEIIELHKLGTGDFAFYDDALLANADSHIKIILQEVIRSGMKIRFHCPNGIHVRFIDNELARLFMKSGFTTLRLSLETVDTDRQFKTGNKVTSGMLEQAVMNLQKQGFRKEHIGVYLMYGLPGQSLREVEEGVAFLKGLGVRINLTEYSPIPYTSCWKELIRNGIINDDIDPLLTNNSVFSVLCGEYGFEEVEKLKNEVKQYNST